MPAEAWSRVFDVNVTGTFMKAGRPSRGTARSGRRWRGRQRHDRIGSQSRPGGAVYAASKAAVETMSKVFAMELGPSGIRVNVGSPGYLDVRQRSEAFPDRAPEKLRAALADSIPLGGQATRVRRASEGRHDPVWHPVALRATCR
jgi:NAD(P)-dependent dehydrogenase (short-subunit alcohol dehydrogenase family)